MDGAHLSRVEISRSSRRYARTGCRRRPRRQRRPRACRLCTSCYYIVVRVECFFPVYRPYYNNISNENIIIIIISIAFVVAAVVTGCWATYIGKSGRKRGVRPKCARKTMRVLGDIPFGGGEEFLGLVRMPTKRVYLSIFVTAI